MKFTTTLLMTAGLAAAAPPPPLFAVSDNFNLAARVGPATETSYQFAASTNGTDDRLFLYPISKGPLGEFSLWWS
jgi:hypothetical protein